MSGPRSSNARALAEVALASGLLAALEIAFLIDGPVSPAWVVVLFPLVGCIYIAAGVLASLRRPSNRTGSLLILGGLSSLVAALANLQPDALVAAGLICTTLSFAIVVHLVHGFPSGRLRGTFSRVTVIVGYFVALVLQAPMYLFGRGERVLMIADRPELVDAGRWAQDILGALVMLATSALLVQRLRAATPAQRRVLAPLFTYAIGAVLFVVITAQVADHVFPHHEVARVVIQLALMAGIPVAFAISVLLGGFARMGEVEELGAWLGADAGEGRTLTQALAETLGDPSLQLALWVPAAGGYVGYSGGAVVLPATGSGRAAVEVQRGDRRIGAIVYDATLIADASLVRAAARVIAIALDHERLTAELTASSDELRRSRARIVSAADQERRRIARDLHDGLQAQLVVLAIGANGLAGDSELPAEARAEAIRLRTGLEVVVSELRSLVQGVMPAALIERGLSAATEDLADRMPIPTALAIEDDLDHASGKLPPAIELAGYFVVAEALTNAVKHAQARELTVRLARPNGSLHIEVSDDGIGGAATGAGSGMRGMADRVDVLGGELTITSPLGGGTRVVAVVPCAS